VINMKSISNDLPKLVFWSRWLQAPLYFGLIVVLIFYVYEFALGLINLLIHANTMTENEVMLQALDLIDVVMIANLLIMVIIGGYQTFISKLHLQSHPDKPEWLDEVNAGTMKIKLALALIGISSIHLLRTFIDLSQKDTFEVMWQVIIHVTLLVSALAIAFANKLMSDSH
jgi:uncharacterized protein (TIGR00645 family)